MIVEHTSINPNKAAHIGHLRNATLGDTFVRVLRDRGHQVGVQNYIDDTGVQVADVVVGFRHLEKKGLDEVAAIPGNVRLLLLGPLRSGRRLLRRRSEAQDAAGGDAARHRGRRQRDRGLAAHVAARIVDCHLATMERLGIRYDLLAHESDILRLHFWDRAFELLKAAGRHPPRDRGQERRLLGAGDGGATASDEDKIIVRSNGTVTYTGKDIAYQLWKLGRLDRDFRYRRHRTYADGHVLWSTTSDAGETGAPVFGHAARRLQRDRRRPVLSAARGEGRRGGPRPRRGGGRAAITSPTRRSCSRRPPRAPSATPSPRTRPR